MNVSLHSHFHFYFFNVEFRMRALPGTPLSVFLEPGTSSFSSAGERGISEIQRVDIGAIKTVITGSRTMECRNDDQMFSQPVPHDHITSGTFSQ
ncbi:MAG: hypothetical protein HXS41_01575 [Theionarchaea archaeon]|nr:hypothetical protein [Theionarchaea archaeon]MBU7001509.1 hypothetical protein [Theionarchaea archaeon]MBU7019718.1 hypothetical protein [Theionarchaea archaeon]MBU7034429.1 hypothetical protein [Theionarchaea archaeon]MBU7040640.1 hypothetical protein [Theionarchaea archaeon]